MVKRTGSSNKQLIELIRDLKKQAIDQKVNIWKRIANDLEKPTRNRRIVNIHKLNKFTKENEAVIVPGKVLGTGDIEHKLIVAAFDFSDGAVEKIKKANGECITIQELIKKNPKGSQIRIIG